MRSPPPTSRPQQDKPFVGPYLQLLLPLILAHVLQGVGGLIDGLWVAHLMGIAGIATVSAFFPVFFVMLSIIIGMSAAVTVLAGKAWSASDFRAARRIGFTTVSVAFGAGVGVAIVGGFWAEDLMRLLGTPSDIVGEATVYARTILVAMPLTFTLWTCMALSRGAGDPHSPMWAVVVATGVSALATPALVAGWGGWAGFGVTGAAISNLAAQVVAFGVLLLRLARARHPLVTQGPRSRDFRFDPATGGQMLRIGVPASMQMLSMALAEMVLLGLVNRHGTAVTAAYGAATQLLSWIQFPAMCLGIAASILSSHVIGAGRGHRVLAVVKAGLWMNAAVTTAFVAVGHVLAPVALGMFLQDPQALEIAVGMMRTVAWSVVLLGWSNVLVGAMRASGTVAVPTALGMFAILCVELPAAIVLEPRLGLDGLWWAYPAGFGAMLLLQAVYGLASWRHRPMLLRVA